MNFFGCSGFYYSHWIERFYPSDLPKSKWLEFYSKHFNALEINSSFYHFPKEKTLEGWRNRTPQNFKIVLKANRSITHYKKFSGTKKLVKNFYELAELLEEKLGGILFQFPPSLHKDLSFLKKAFNQLDPKKNNFFEFRHKSWFDEKVYNLCKENGVSFCSVSAPPRYSMLEELIQTTDNAYIRFHGKNKMYRYNYSEKELSEWAEKIKKASPSLLFVFFNNDFEANAIKNCKTLRKMLSGE